jgi:hypothetical protein
MAVIVSVQVRRMAARIMTSGMAELKFPGEVPGTTRPTVGSGEVWSSMMEGDAGLA